MPWLNPVPLLARTLVALESRLTNAGQTRP